MNRTIDEFADSRVSLNEMSGGNTKQFGRLVSNKMTIAGRRGGGFSVFLTDTSDNNVSTLMRLAIDAGHRRSKPLITVANEFLLWLYRKGECLEALTSVHDA